MNDMSSPLSAMPGTQTHEAPSRRVIDAPVRMFHWLFAFCFVGAYLTAESEHWRLVHVTLGYTFAGLLGFRVLYGLFGPRQARIVLWWRKVSGARTWLASLLPGRSAGGVNWRQGQNLLVALAVVAMMATVLPLTLSGYAVYSDWGSEWLEEIHEFFAHVFLNLVLAHLALLLLLSLLRRNNLSRPMLTGRQEGRGPDLAKHNHAWLAILLLASVLLFWGTEWRSDPQPANDHPARVRADHHDDDD